MNKFKQITLFSLLSGLCSIAIAQCEFTNKELQTTCFNIEKSQEEGRQVLQNTYEEAAKKFRVITPSFSPAINVASPINNQQINTANSTSARPTSTNSMIPNQNNQLNIFSTNNNKQSTFK